MSDDQTDDPNPPETSSVANVSGGVNVDARRDVNIGGDVVGRDKIVDSSIKTGDINAKAVAVGQGAKVELHEHIHYRGPELAEPAGVSSKVDDFRTEYARFFVGRQAELSKLDEWLKATDVPFALVAAPAGWGKSALLANWVDRLQREGTINVVYHPISDRYGINARKEILASLLSQLTRFYRQDEPRDNNWDPDHLENRLGILLKEPPPDAPPVLVVIDGLDEVAESPERYLRLPNRIAPNIRLLVSMRTGDDSRSLRDWLDHLNWTPTVYRRIDLGQLSLTDLEDVPRQLGLSVGLSVESNLRKQLVEALYWLSDKGDALTLALYLGKIQDDLSNGKSMTTEYIDDLRRGSPGLGTYLIDTLKYLKNTAGSFQPMLDVLSIALGPLAERDFNAVGVPLPDSLDTFVAHTRHLVVRTTEGRCSFGHSRIREAYKKHHMTDTRCKEISDKFIQYGTEVIQQLQQGLPPKEVPAYIVRHYSEHLVENNPILLDQLSDLLSEPWMTAHFLAAGSYDGFLSDVARIRESAEQYETKDRLAWSLGIQMKCAMCIASVASITGNLPPSFPASLVLDGKWNIDQAIGYAARVPDQIQRVRTWLALFKVSSNEMDSHRRDLVNAILDTLERLDKSHEVLCARVLIDLTPHLRPGEVLLKQAQDLARSLSSPAWRARVLAHMLPLASTADEQIQLLAEVLRACSEMSPFDDDQKRLSPYTLEAVVEHMPAGTLAPALALAFPVQEYSDRKGALLEGLARHMTKKLADEFLQVCVDAEWSSSHYRAATLIHLAPILPSDSLKSAARYIVGLAKRERYRDFNSSTFHDMPSIGLLILARHVPVLDEETKREILALARGSMPLDVAAQQAIYQEILALARWCIRRDVGSFYCRHYDKALQTLELLFGLGVGEVSDEEVARRFDTCEIELDEDDFDMFCLLGPLSAAAVATDYVDIPFYQGQFIRTSPYFLTAIATQLANQDTGLVLQMAFDKDKYEEDWGRLRAIASVADRLLPEHRGAAIQYAIANGGYTDDNKTAALAAFGSYLSTEQVLDIVNSSIRWSAHSAPWSLLGNIIKRLDNDVRKEAAIKLKEKLNRAYDLNSAESMVVLTANHPDKEWCEQIWQTVISRADLVDDLSARWSMIERLGANTKDRQRRRLWRSQLLTQTRAAIDPSLPLSYRLSQLESSLPYLPFTQRGREVYKLLADPQTGTSASLSPAKMVGVSLLASLMASNRVQRTWHSLIESNIMRPKALFRKFFVRVLRWLARLRPVQNAEQENVERILRAAQQEVAHITQQNTAEHSELLQMVYGHLEPIYGGIEYFQSRLLRERGADIWRALPEGCFEQAIDVAIEREADLHTREMSAFRLAVLLSGLKSHKSDLLTGLQDTIDTYYNGTFQQPLLLALLADYASEDSADYIARIDHALQAAGNLINDPQESIGRVLLHAARFAPAEALLEMAVRLVNHSSNAAVSDETIATLLILMERPEVDLKVFKKIWPEDDLKVSENIWRAARQLFDRMSALPPYHRQLGKSSYLNRFVNASAPYLNGKRVGELFLALCEQPGTSEIHEAIARVRDHWLKLCDESPLEALKAWRLVMHELSQKPRAQFLDKAEWLVRIIAKLGGNQAVVNTGDGIIEVSGWKWIAVKAK